MAERYFFYDSNNLNETLIPVANGSHETRNMNMAYCIGNVFLQFYDANGDPVTPTGGSVTFHSGAFDEQYLTAPTVVQIDATTVIAGDATYTPPTFDSAVLKSRMTLSGITGATHVRAFHWRCEGGSYL